MSSIDYQKLTNQLYIDINKTRENPESIIPYLKKMKTFFKKKEYSDPSLNFALITNEGMQAVDETINFLEKQKKTPKLQKNEKLEKSVNLLLTKIGPEGITKHQKGDLSLKTRTQKFLEKTGIMAENISFGMNRSLDIISQMLVDDGVKSRGHRKNFFNEKFSEIGISTGEHSIYGTCGIFNFFGDGGDTEIFKTYFIEKDEWPKDAVSVEQKCKVGTLDGVRKVCLEYVFKLENGKEVLKKKEFKEEVV